MNDFVPGQRWINDAQLQMGLGSVLKADYRTVTVIFLATGETFVYSKSSVPLTRVRFVPGDQIITHEEQVLDVVAVDEINGLITYSGKNQDGQVLKVDESLLSHFIQLNRPNERIFNGQVDRDIWFELRYQTRLMQLWCAENPLRGLVGGRVSLIPHQLYIAHTVASRHAPRVLLADEVGLGKTIEAGMIVHQQLITERAARVLIIVPESLVHQWLVEMLRRFNLMFKVFDNERFESFSDVDEITGEVIAGELNPFLTEQLVLCSLKFLSSRPEVFKQCHAAGWDLMVVDEAHHLQWSEHDPGFEYQLVAHLAQSTPGVLLLTATPEQLGKSSHYARLRLLDPERFPSYQTFLEEEETYQPIADLVEKLLEGGDIGLEAENLLLSILENDLTESLLANLKNTDSAVCEREKATESLVQMLLDRHGTGRVLFRNTRATVKGFPDRVLNAYRLALPDDYKNLLIRFEDAQLENPQLLLCPELLYQATREGESKDWTAIDPRVSQLAELLKKFKSEKVLVIAASADTALDLVSHLKMRQGINASVFHEDMSMIERDRAAAWFADQLSGTQVMVCSEIGSEGRNFQFSHHLVLFDLPLNPDLLEQRIGRLDRIGQTETIYIHSLILEDSAQQVMFDWYHLGLDAFQKTCPTGFSVFNELEADLIAWLHKPSDDYTDLIGQTGNLHKGFTEALQWGRDRLLEFNSCRPGIAQEIRNEALEQDNDSQVQQYMENAFDCFGVDYEIHSEGCFTVNAGTHMAVPFPQMPEEGMTVTYDRSIALTYEDFDYLTWDHPLVTGAMDLVLTGEMGNTSVIAAPIPGIKRGTIVVESIFILESASNMQLQSSRYLPPTAIRIMIDQSGKRLDQYPSYRRSADSGERLELNLIRRILHIKHNLLRKMLTASEKLAHKMMPQILQSARDRSTQTLEREIQRLESLMMVNPNVRQEEIDFYRQQLSAIHQRLDAASLRLDAVRVIVAT